MCSLLYNKAFKIKLLEARIAEKQKGCNMLIIIMYTTWVCNTPYSGLSALHNALAFFRCL